jgi:acyl carrier protein
MENKSKSEINLNWIICTCQELLCLNNLKADDDFFDLGADSLTVIKLFSRIEREYGANKLNIDHLFEQSQLDQIAYLLD